MNPNDKPNDNPNEQSHESVSPSQTAQALSQWLLDRDLTLAQLAYASQMHERVTSDAALASYLRNMEAVREALAIDDQTIAPPTGGYDQWVDDLQQQINDAATTGSQTAKHTKATIGHNHRSSWLLATTAGTAVAAMAAVLIMAVTLLWQTTPEQQMDRQSLVTTAGNNESQFLPDAPALTSQTLRELWQFYDGQANWVAMTGSDMRLGLSSHAIPMSDMMVVSLSLTGPGGQILKTDIALVPGQDVDLVVPRDQGKSLRYQLKVISDSQVNTQSKALSLKLTATMDDGVSITTTFPLNESSVKKVGRLLTARGDYQLHLGMAKSMHNMRQDTVQ